MSITDTNDVIQEEVASLSAVELTGGRVQSLLATFRTDHLVRNSFFIMLATATMGVLGFAFWVLCARLFTPAEIGVATTLISASSLISYLSLLGFNGSLVRFLPTSQNRNREINTSLVLTMIMSIVISSGYVLAVPLFSQKLTFVASSIPYAIGFVVFTAFTAMNLLTDSVFIAYRSAKYNFIVDGLLQSGSKLLLPVAFVGAGAYGVFASSGAAAVLAVTASIVFMVKLFEYKPKFEVSLDTVRSAFHFSVSNYISNVLNIAPLLVLPVILINGRGAEAAGYYNMAFQIANLANSIAYAICQSLFAEGSHAGADLRHLAVRSGKILTLATVPIVAVLVLGGHLLLRVFGDQYAEHAGATLVVLGGAVLACALYAWTGSLLRLRMQMTSLMVVNVIYVVSICGLAALWVHKGLMWVALAWLAGNSITGLASGIALLVRARKA